MYSGKFLLAQITTLFNISKKFTKRRVDISEGIFYTVLKEVFHSSRYVFTIDSVFLSEQRKKRKKKQVLKNFLRESIIENRTTTYVL